MLMFIKVGEMGTFITCLVNTQIEIEPEVTIMIKYN